MILGRVVGTVVSTHKEQRIEGSKFLLIEKVDVATMDGKGEYVVAMDTVGAGSGEIVFYAAGSSSRMTTLTEGKPCDSAIIAIVDSIDLTGKLVYSKGRL